MEMKNNSKSNRDILNNIDNSKVPFRQSIKSKTIIINQLGISQEKEKERSIGNSLLSIYKHRRSKILKESSESKVATASFSQLNKSKNQIPKKKIIFKQPFIEYINIESYKLYNEKMTFNDPVNSSQEHNNVKKKVKLCNKCIVF